MKVYISSTCQDLAEHRSAVDRTLRRMGHDVIGMEQYVAEGNKPLDRCLKDVELADLYVVIVAWRYGYVPLDQSPSGSLSITELEYNKAIVEGKPILAFLLDPDTPWPTSRVDAMSTEAQRGESRPGDNIARFRSLLGTNYLAGMFRTADDVARQVAAAVAAQGLNRFMVDRALVQTSVNAGEMGGCSRLYAAAYSIFFDEFHQEGARLHEMRSPASLSAPAPARPPCPAGSCSGRWSAPWSGW
jgi:hypothetical protein